MPPLAFQQPKDFYQNATNLHLMNKKDLHLTWHIFYQELYGWRTVLREATVEPTKCAELATGHLYFIEMIDASTEGVEDIVVRENEAVKPAVF